MASSEYWKKREHDWQDECKKQNVDWQKKLDEIYQTMSDEISDQIAVFYQRYADQNQMTLSQAKRYLNQTDIRYYSSLAKRYCEDATADMNAGTWKHDASKSYFSAQANREMKRYNTTMKIACLDMIKHQIDLRIANAQRKVCTVIGDALQDRTLQTYTRQAGILGKTVLHNLKNAETIVKASFHGTNFSDRVWGKQQDELKKALKRGLENCLILGKGAAPFTRELKKETKKTAFQARRLMSTELASVQTQAALDSMKESGFEEFQLVASPDCCDDCKALDGQHYPIPKLASGVNAPPMHPLCRCSIAPYMVRDEEKDDDFDEAAFDEWSETFDEHELSWEEWQEKKNNAQKPEKKQYTVDDIPELEAEVKKFQDWMLFGGEYDPEKGKAANRELKRLKDQLKNQTPEWAKIPDFQNMKIPEIENWIAENVQTNFGPAKGASKEVIAETVKAIRLVEERIGGPVPGVDTVVFGLGNMQGYAAAHYNERTWELSLPKRPKGGLTKYEKDRKAWAEATDPPEVATTSFIGDVLHEVGHAVDISSGRKLEKMFFSGTDPINENGKAMLKVSRYASMLSRTRGREEAIAENFSAWLDPNKERTDKVPIKVQQVFDEALKELGKKSNFSNERPMSNGMRRSNLYKLTDADIKYVVEEAKAIGISTEYLCFDQGRSTSYSETLEKIQIRGDVFPDEYSSNNRDLLSVRAVLAHEFYGHKAFEPSGFPPQDWRDEFRASYFAALNAPGLSPEDRSRLMQDAYDRAAESGYNLRKSQAALKILWGE